MLVIEKFFSCSMLAHRRHSVVLQRIQTIFGSGFNYARIYPPRQTLRSQQHTLPLCHSPFHPQLCPAKAITYSVQNGPFGFSGVMLSV